MGRIKVHEDGDTELSTPGSAMVLTSPNGKKWRVTVDVDGELQTQAVP
jgi:hypothetical protein